MFILGNFVITVAKLLDIFLTAMYWVILIRVLVSWVSADPFNPVVRFLHQVTEPVLEPIRRFLPLMALDLSPFIAVLIIYAARSFVVASLFDLAAWLR